MTKPVEVVKWHCSVCGCVLGHIEDKHTIRIKRKDLYVEIKGGASVTEICYRCGKPNTIHDDGLPTGGQVDLQENEKGGE